MQRCNCPRVRVQKSASTSANARECECHYSPVQVKPLASRVAHANRLISGGIASIYSNSTAKATV